MMPSQPSEKGCEVQSSRAVLRKTALPHRTEDCSLFDCHSYSFSSCLYLSLLIYAN